MAQAVSKRLPRYLRKRRESAGMTLRQLSGKTRIPHNTLQQLEAGRIDVRISRLESIARAYGEDLVMFLGGVRSSAAKHVAALRDFNAIGEK